MEIVILNQSHGQKKYNLLYIAMFCMNIQHFIYI